MHILSGLVELYNTSQAWQGDVVKTQLRAIAGCIRTLLACAMWAKTLETCLRIMYFLGNCLQAKQNEFKNGFNKDPRYGGLAN